PRHVLCERTSIEVTEQLQSSFNLGSWPDPTGGSTMSTLPVTPDQARGETPPGTASGRLLDARLRLKSDQSAVLDAWIVWASSSHSRPIRRLRRVRRKGASFWRGFASVFTEFPTEGRGRAHPGSQTDAEALWSDWRAVGGDLARV